MATDVPPTIQLLVAPAPGDTVYYVQSFSWQGHDADGAISHYLYAVDPPFLGDTAWVATTATMQPLFFATTTALEPLPPSGPIWFVSPHVFAIKAVDHTGLESAPVSRAFYTYTIAPDVNIVSPTPNPYGVKLVGTNVTIDWQGVDWDGALIDQPVRYKYRIFPRHNPDFPDIPDFIAFATSPATVDSFRRLYAPGFGPSEHCPTCSPWDSTGMDSSQVSYTNLTPASQYLFCVVGFDDAGAYSARFGPAINMLRMAISTGVSVEDRYLPGALQLDPLWPNPVVNTASLRFVLPRDCTVAVRVYDAAGRRVRELASGPMTSGEHRSRWDLTDEAGHPVGAGVYLVRLEGMGTTLSRRIAVVR